MGNPIPAGSLAFILAFSPLALAQQQLSRPSAQLSQASSTHPAPPQGSNPGQRSRSTSDQASRDIEERKLAIEEDRVSVDKRKVDIDAESLQVERFKAWWTGFSIILSLLIGSATLGVGIWQQRRQAVEQFEAKAAEIVMNARGPHEALNRAKTLAALFPNRLPPNFAESFDADKYGRRTHSGKQKLIELLSARCTPNQLLGVWRQIYPADQWARDLDIPADEGARPPLPSAESGPIRG